MDTPEKKVTIKDLYPELSDEELVRAEDNWKQYVQLALKIFQRIEQDPEAFARLKVQLEKAEVDAPGEV